MHKKEYYKHNLPHFQQPGQAYFVTWSLNDVVPKHALKHFTKKLEMLKSQLDGNSLIAATMGLADSDPRLKEMNRGLETAKPREEIEKLKKEYNSIRKSYLKAYNELLDSQQHPMINLATPDYTEILKTVLLFWENKRLKNYAFCIMPNHVHWVFKVLEKDENGEQVYLQDILYSVKRFSANHLNNKQKKTGVLWQKESFDTTIKDYKHLYNCIEYTLNNPVNAGFVKSRNDWAGNWCVDW